MEMSPETIKALLDAFERSDWREMVGRRSARTGCMSRGIRCTDAGAAAAARPRAERRRPRVLSPQGTHRASGS